MSRIPGQMWSPCVGDKAKELMEGRRDARPCFCEENWVEFWLVMLSPLYASLLRSCLPIENGSCQDSGLRVAPLEKQRDCPTVEEWWIQKDLSNKKILVGFCFSFWMVVVFGSDWGYRYWASGSIAILEWWTWRSLNKKYVIFILQHHQDDHFNAVLSYSFAL